MADLVVAPPASALAAAGASDKGEAKPDAAADAKALAEKTAAEVAAKPFTELSQLKLPDGQKLDDASTSSFLALAKEHGFTAKQAQGLLEFQTKTGGAAEAARIAARDTVAKTTADSLRADKDIGGANFEASMKLAGKAIAYIGDPALKEALENARMEDGSMLGDQPWFAKILVNLGKKVSEDRTGAANAGNGKAAADDASALQKALYTHPTSKALKFD